MKAFNLAKNPTHLSSPLSELQKIQNPGNVQVGFAGNQKNKVRICGYSIKFLENDECGNAEFENEMPGIHGFRMQIINIRHSSFPHSSFSCMSFISFEHEIRINNLRYINWLRV